VQQAQPQIYDSLTKNLTPEEQAVIQAVINQADVIAHNAAASAVLEQQQQQQQHDPTANGQAPATPSLEAPPTGI
jgi:DNA replication initiation complex subunit (GINS family)